MLKTFTAALAAFVLLAGATAAVACTDHAKVSHSAAKVSPPICTIFYHPKGCVERYIFVHSSTGYTTKKPF